MAKKTADMTVEDRGYTDLHEHIEELRDKGLLIEIDREINKDTEMHPLVRWQFRGGIDEEDRKAFLFTNITDSKGRKYDIPVLVCGLAGNQEIYQVGMRCDISELKQTWIDAINNPIEPNMVKAPTRLGMNPSTELRTGGYMHWLEWKKLGKPMPVAVVIGAPPVVSFTAVQKVPEKLDELAVSGGLAGAPLNVTRCKTVDLIVPAESEIVIEGLVSTELLEPEAPFGESHGHVNLQEYNAYLDITAITRRKKSVMTSWVSQVTPSESGTIKRPAYEARQIEHLRDHLGIKGIKHVSTHEPLTSLHKLIIVVVERGIPRTEIWRAMYGVASLRQAEGKWIICVNEDIDPDDTDAVFWAMSYRCKPHNDVEILKHKHEGHGPRSLLDPEDSAVLIDATLKETFPPVSLPKREFMEKAKKIWEELGLPKLKPKAPWFGYDMGEWNSGLEAMARRAVKSEYWTTGQIIAQRRRGDVPINTEIRTLDMGNPGAGDDVDETLTWDKLEDASQVKDKDK
jgi:4-hydroxy-3-polyprenylbenzoate decarboxylase